MGEYINPARLEDGFRLESGAVVGKISTQGYRDVVPDPTVESLARYDSFGVVGATGDGLDDHHRQDDLSPGPEQFFVAIVFPYLLIVILSYTGQRVVYALGKEATRPRGTGQLSSSLRAAQTGRDGRSVARDAPAPCASGRHQAAQTVARRGRRCRDGHGTALSKKLRSPRSCAHRGTRWSCGISAWLTTAGFASSMKLLDRLAFETLVERYGPVPAELSSPSWGVATPFAEAEARGLFHPRHQARQHPRVPLWRQSRLREGPRLRDGGVCVARRRPMPTSTAATQEHVLRGTPAFIAPEQVLARDPDRQSHRWLFHQLRHGTGS